MLITITNDVLNYNTRVVGGVWGYGNADFRVYIEFKADCADGIKCRGRKREREKENETRQLN